MDVPTYFLVCLHRPCTQEAADFIVDSLSKPAADGGAGLVVRQEAMPKNRSGLVLHVSAPKRRLFELAEAMDLKKRDFELDVTRPFKADESKVFGESGVVGPLTISDIHKCVLHAMESVHLDASTKCLPGHPKEHVMKRSPVLDAYRSSGLIDTFPIHDDESLTKLYGDWKRSPLLSPPVDLVRDYFGENIAFYVSFTAFYTRFLIPTAALGVVQFVTDKLLGYSYYNTVVFCLLNLVVVTVFLEMWKRRSNDHSYKWGTGGKLRHKRPRAQFRGEYGINPITGREEVRYPTQKTIQKLIFVSIPVTFLCLCFAFVLMLISFWAETVTVIFFTDEKGEVARDIFSQIAMFVPCTIYSVLIFVMNQYYLHVAHHLTEWENHRTQEQFERHVVAKLVMFEFVNSFLAMFYIAFVLQDVSMLKNQVFTMLLVQQAVNQVQETLLPIFLRRPSARRVMNKISKRVEPQEPLTPEKCLHGEVRSVDKLVSDSPRIPEALFSLLREPYESTYDDFVEMWLQFGSVFLFSSVYPLAAVFALINNVIELKMDAYKLCKFTRKPTPRGVRDIGVWYAAFNITSVFSVMTNCALLAMDIDLRQAFDFGLTDLRWMLLFIGLEHVFLVIRIMISWMIPDVSSETKKAIDKDDHVLKNR